MPLRPGQEIEIEVDRLAMEGRAVGRLDDLVVFVEKALPGERVRAQVGRCKRTSCARLKRTRSSPPEG